MPTSNGEGASPNEVILVTRPVAAPPPTALSALRDVVTSTVGMATYTAETVASIVEQSVIHAVTSTVSSALDRMVPAIADAVIARIDLTAVVIDRVDLNKVINSALDSMDLTQLVIDRVDIDEVVAQANIEDIIDRVPMIPIAHYVMDEIDLPQIIRSSTSGVASDALNSIRVQGVAADQLISQIADRLILRRRARKVDAPGEPQSLGGSANGSGSL